MYHHVALWASKLESHVDSYYLRRMKAPPCVRAALTTDLVVDVCVVGGGLAGICTALGLAERGKTVAVLEANQVGWGASGRNGGFCLPGYQLEAEDLIKQEGPEVARSLYDISMDALHLLRSRIDKFRIDCAVKDCGNLMLSCFSADEKEVAKEVSDVNAVLGTNMEVWSSETVRENIRTDFYRHGVFDPVGFTVRPLQLTLGLAQAAEKAGARIYEGTRAVGLHPSGSGVQGDQASKVRWAVKCETGRHVFARDVVLAGNYHLSDDVDQEVNRSTVALHTYIITTPPLPRTDLERAFSPAVLDRRLPVCDDRFALAYFRPLEDNRILWGGLATAYPVDVDEAEKQLLQDFHTVFPQLAHVKSEVCWGGVVNVGRQWMPLIGQRKPGLWYSTGYGGHGVVATTAGGELIASAIASDGKDDRWRLFGDRFSLQYVGWPARETCVWWVQKSYLLWEKAMFLKQLIVG